MDSTAALLAAMRYVQGGTIERRYDVFRAERIGYREPASRKIAPSERLVDFVNNDSEVTFFYDVNNPRLEIANLGTDQCDSVFSAKFHRFSFDQASRSLAIYGRNGRTDRTYSIRIVLPRSPAT
jgi:hypothetical protein